MDYRPGRCGHYRAKSRWSHDGLAGEGNVGNFNPLFLTRQHDLTGPLPQPARKLWTLQGPPFPDVRRDVGTIPRGGAILQNSSCVSRIKIGRRLFPALGDHFGGIRLSRYSARSELFSLDVIFGAPWPSVVNLATNLDAFIVYLSAGFLSRGHPRHPLLVFLCHQAIP